MQLTASESTNFHTTFLCKPLEEKNQMRFFWDLVCEFRYLFEVWYPEVSLVAQTVKSLPAMWETWV